MSSNNKPSQNELDKVWTEFQKERNNLPVGVNLLPQGNNELLNKSDCVYSGILKKFINPETGEVIEE